MALDETTRQVNLRAIDALEEASKRLHESDIGVVWAMAPLRDLSRYTNAHDEVVEDMQTLSNQIVEVRENLARRVKAESEGTRR